MADLEGKTACRTPSKGRAGVTNIPTWKYDALRDAILAAIGAAGADGLAFSELPEAVKSRLSPDQLARLGSVGWHVTTVKLNLEVEGEIARMPGVVPQRLILVPRVMQA
jgi:Family of unknown function (DUF6958)